MAAPAGPEDTLSLLKKERAELLAKLAANEADTGRLTLLEGGLSAEDYTPAGPPVALPLFEYMQQPKVAKDWLIEGLVASGGVGVLSSDPYMGKSTLLAQMAVSIAAGVPWCGFPKPVQGTTLYWQAEGNPRIFAERIACACFHLGVPVEGLPLLLPPPEFLTEFDTDIFREFVHSTGASFVVCDTAFFFTEDADENSANDWKAMVIKPLKRVARATGATFLLTHHYGKPSETRTGKHKPRGTSAILGDCDLIMRLEPTSGEGRTLFVDKVKDAAEVEAVALVFDKSTATFSRDADPEIKVPIATAKKEENRAHWVTKMRENIVMHLKREPGGLSMRQLHEACGGNRDVFDEVRNDLVRNHVIYTEPGPRNSILAKIGQIT